MNNKYKRKSSRLRNKKQKSLQSLEDSSDEEYRKKVSTNYWENNIGVPIENPNIVSTREEIKDMRKSNEKLSKHCSYNIVDNIDNNLNILIQKNNEYIATDITTTESKKMFDKKVQTTFIGMNMINNMDINQSLYGHFKLGDVASEIISATYINFHQSDDIICQIEWKIRKDGILPLRTYITGKEIKDYNPFLLLDFYESIIRSAHTELLIV